MHSNGKAHPSALLPSESSSMHGSGYEYQFPPPSQGASTFTNCCTSRQCAAPVVSAALRLVLRHRWRDRTLEEGVTELELLTIGIDWSTRKHVGTLADTRRRVMRFVQSFTCRCSADRVQRTAN
jgi:hypothetical protein